MWKHECAEYASWAARQARRCKIAGKSVMRDYFHYDATRDGKKFLINSRTQGAPQPLILFQNWTADSKK